MSSSSRFLALALAPLLFAASHARADDYHYREILIGERAAGLGGAYVAISDDPSGLWHNPAGIMFSFENYFSLSANAYYSTTEVFKNTIAGQDYKYSTGGLVPSFFGFTQNYDRMKWGFGIVVPNDDRFDQDDDITGISTAAGQARSFSRKFYRQNTNTSIGGGLAWEARKNMTLGFSAFGQYHVDKIIDNQIIIFNQDAGGDERFYIQNSTIDKTVVSLLPKFGAQWMPMENVSMGAVISKKLTLNGQRKFKQTKTSTSGTTGLPIDPIGSVDTDLPRSSSSEKTTDPSPIELGLGMAWFPDKTFLITGDLHYYTDDPAFDDFKVVSTWNIAGGIEYFWTERAAWRVGLFTNNANTPPVESGKRGQPTHVDVYNLTLSYSVTTPGSSFSVGGLYGTGKGKGQAVDSTAIQEVERSTVSVFITGSYQM